MANKSTNSSRMTWQQRVQTLPLGVRRCGAWVVEVSLIVVSGVVPFSIGLYANEHSSREQVPLNSALAIAQNAIAQSLAIPVYQKNRQVAPATNFWWTLALAAPLLVTGWQIYLLGVKGQTLPKRWFGIEVVTASGNSTGIKIVLIRECIGRTALPVAMAFSIWRYTGAYPDLGVLSAIAGLLWLGDALGGKFHPRQQTWHDRLANTLVIDTTKTTEILTGSFPPLPPKWSLENPDIRVPNNTILNGQSASLNSRSIWNLMGRYPRRITLMLFVASMAITIASFIATQIYIQNQENRRLAEQQKNQLFLALVRQLNASANASFEERQAAILAMGAAKDDPRALQLLVDLVGKEKDPNLIETLQQAIVKIGPDALPYLQRLNQTLAKKWETLPKNNNYFHKKADSSQDLAETEPIDKFTKIEEAESEKSQLVELQLRATQEAIANILALDLNPNAPKDLSQTTLSEISINKIYQPSSHQIKASKNSQNDDLPKPSNHLLPFILILDKIDLSGINFRGAILNNASFQSSRFWGAGKDGFLGTFDDWIADFSGAELKQANFSGAIISHVSMVNTSLSNANFSQANLFQADLTNSNLSSAKLIGTNLHQTILKNANLAGADLTEANLSGANLQAASLSRVNAVGTQFKFADLDRSDWRKADLSGADFSGAKLPDANFSETKLVGTNFRGANLQNVNFRNADLKLADFRGADLQGADFQGAIFVAARINRPDGFVQSAIKVGMGTRVEGVNFGKAKNLDVRQLTYICAQGGHHPRCQ